MTSAYNFNLSIKDTFSSPLECPFYTGLTIACVTQFDRNRWEYNMKALSHLVWFTVTKSNPAYAPTMLTMIFFNNKNHQFFLFMEKVFQQYVESLLNRTFDFIVIYLRPSMFFFRVLRFSPPITLIAMIELKYCW